MQQFISFRNNMLTEFFNLNMSGREKYVEIFLDKGI